MPEQPLPRLQYNLTCPHPAHTLCCLMCADLSQEAPPATVDLTLSYSCFLAIWKPSPGPGLDPTCDLQCPADPCVVQRSLSSSLEFLVPTRISKLVLPRGSGPTRCRPVHVCLWRFEIHFHCFLRAHGMMTISFQMRMYFENVSEIQAHEDQWQSTPPPKTQVGFTSLSLETLVCDDKCPCSMGQCSSITLIVRRTSASWTGFCLVSHQPPL